MNDKLNEIKQRGFYVYDKQCVLLQNATKLVKDVIVLDCKRSCTAF